MSGATISLEPTLAEALPALVAELRQLAANLQRPRLSDSSWLRSIQDKQRELAERIGELRQSLQQKRGALEDTLAQLSTDLQEGARELAVKTSRPYVRELRARFSRGYEDLVAQLRAAKILAPADEASLRALRLPRPVRSIFHAATGLICVLLYHFVVTRSQAFVLLGAFASVFAILEITRRFSTAWNDFLVDRVFGLISRPRERYQVNSATYYLSAMAIIVWATPQAAVGLALLVLAFGDPIASFVGARWGKTRLYNDKSLLGSSAFFLAAFVASTIYLLVAGPAMSLGYLLLVATVVSLVGALTELFSDRLDDNLTIPLLCAFTAMFLL